MKGWLAHPANKWADIPNERSVEIVWATEKCQRFPVLDVGCRESIYLGDLGGEVQGIDVREMKRDGLNAFWRADIRTWQHYRTFPTVLALSTIEHVGLAVRSYETSLDDESNGDRAAVEGCMRNLDRDGVFLLTVPAHRDTAPRIVYDWYRSYSAQGLADLLDGYPFEVETIFNKDWPVGGVHLATVRHGE